MIVYSEETLFSYWYTGLRIYTNAYTFIKTHILREYKSRQSPSNVLLFKYHASIKNNWNRYKLWRFI